MGDQTPRCCGCQHGLSQEGSPSFLIHVFPAPSLGFGNCPCLDETRIDAFEEVDGHNGTSA